MCRLLLFFSLAISLWGQPRKLLVVSIDGLDHRYLRDRDALKLRIPHLRKLIAEGTWADGVTGVVPTNTWPSHTTLVTGVRATEHGILDNNIRLADGKSERYWYMSYLKAPTLWQAAKRAGRTTAAITWPVTVGDGIDYNVPEYFQGRAGGAMDLKSIEEKATPGLIAAIAQDYPSFATEWMDDRTRALATIHILRRHQPDLTLLHFVDHDSAAHEMGPFSRAANAALEYTDELLGQILAHLPANTVVSIVSDHGFEATSRVLNLAALLPAGSSVTARGGYATTTDVEVAKLLSQPNECVGREVPRHEIDRFLPESPAGLRVFEPAPGCLFRVGKANEPLLAKANEAGGHGHWPTRYQAAFLLAGPGVKKQRLPGFDMREIANRWATILGIPALRP
ncbi:MAG: ectonucleotide pyrophosphatase/phosphodiesterase [Bryobacteraceae bacterium]|nr:ectonucleotide pyrophosphatase/phosphodiesterase [Bryobacteraceae bacterium]